MRNGLKLGLAALAVGGVLSTGCSRTETLDDLKFQGYRINQADGEYVLVFDEKSADTRYDVADLSASSTSKDGLTIGKRYDVEVKRSPLFGASVTAYEPSN